MEVTWGGGGGAKHTRWGDLIVTASHTAHIPRCRSRRQHSGWGSGVGWSERLASWFVAAPQVCVLCVVLMVDLVCTIDAVRHVNGCGVF